MQFATPNGELYEYLNPEQSAFFALYSIPLSSDVTERLAKALARAVALILPAIRDVRMITLIFGNPPSYAITTGTGVDVYIADMSQDPIATAGSHRIYIHAERTAALTPFPIDVAVITLLEELVHTWMNTRDEEIAKLVTARLYGDVVVIDGQYRTKEQATLMAYQAMRETLQQSGDSTQDP